MGDDEEEEEDEVSDEEPEEKIIAKMQNNVKAGKDIKNTKKPAVQDLEKNLKVANKNTLKNSFQVDSDSDDDELGEFDLEAEEGEDDDIEVDSDELDESGDEQDEVLQKLEAIKKRQQ